MSDSGSAPEEQDNAEGNHHHPQFYFDSGDVVFKLKSGTLYKIHASHLGRRAGFFGDMFSLPRSVSTPGQIATEGHSDDNPIEVPHTIEQFDWDHLMTYLFMGPTAWPLTDDFLVSVMRLSHLYDIQDGIDYTTQELTCRGDRLEPPLQFELGRCFGIDIWVEQAFRRLMAGDIISLDSFQVTQIGHYGYFYLTQTKAKIQALRNTIAFHVPPVVNDVDCENPGTCAYSWTREWEERVRQLIHHPEAPISCLDLLDQLRNVHIHGLCDKCQDLTVTWVWGMCLLTKEEGFVEEAIQALMALQADEAIRSALRASLTAGTSG
ncbi:hypothetical protein C8F04DRAFT_301046 [Mycena alexandri]|uniref:BTB domain-containing protein n=1 Tax=Mycena alexandri TaxID=1745969 RepID=A0AAD6S4N5_9AGAR|nr:hypothetical protein C8F04DRAFT_301046 [Mycena alexandri]